MRILGATLVMFSLVLWASGWAGAAPPPPPKFWTASHCERVLHAHDDGGLTEEGYRFHIGLAICVGTTGQHTCTWASDHRSRLYSQFTVFSRARYVGGVIRSFTLATRAGHGFVREIHSIYHHAGWPGDYYMSPASVRLLTTNSTPAGFRSIVARLAAQLIQQQNATSCSSG